MTTRGVIASILSRLLRLANQPERGNVDMPASEALPLAATSDLTDAIQEHIPPYPKRRLSGGALAMTEVHDACEVVRQFQIEGEFAEIAPYGSGHINDSYCAAFDVAGVRLRYMLQRINNNIFKAPIAVMENIQRVTEHLAAQSSGQIDAERRPFGVAC